jgi:hypothetical protein
MGKLGWRLNPGLMLLRIMAYLAVGATLQGMGNLGRHPRSRFMRVMAGFTLFISPHLFHIYLRKVAGSGNKPGMA